MFSRFDGLALPNTEAGEMKVEAAKPNPASRIKVLRDFELLIANDITKYSLLRQSKAVGGKFL